MLNSITVAPDERGLMVWFPLSSLKGHLSSVRCISVLPTGRSSKQTNTENNSEKKSETSFLLFSGGGRAELRVWKLNFSIPVYRHHRHLVDSLPAESTVDQNSRDEFVPSSTNCSHSSLPEQSSSSDSQQSSSSVEQPPLSDNRQKLCSFQHLATHFLGESRHKQKYSTWKVKKLVLDPETRVMDVAVTGLSELSSRWDYEVNDGEMCVVSVAGSDGMLR